MGVGSSNLFLGLTQDDMDFKKKQREEAQKLKEAKALAAKKGPLIGGGIKVRMLNNGF
jgi:hypothetical protein